MLFRKERLMVLADALIGTTRGNGTCDRAFQWQAV